MTAPGLPRRYVSGAYLDRLLGQLSDRDWQDRCGCVGRCRVLSGDQITRLHFFNISDLTRQRTRRVVLARLTDWGVLSPFARRIGGVRGGSAGSVYALDVAGQRLIAARWPDAVGGEQRARRPWTPGTLFVAHALAVSEVYVSLVEQSRAAGFAVEAFTTEPLAWWPNGMRGLSQARRLREAVGWWRRRALVARGRSCHREFANDQAQADDVPRLRSSWPARAARAP